MLSVPLGTAELTPLLGTELSIAASNGPQLSVASGPVAAIEALRRTLAARGVESSRLRINVAAHSKLLEPILPEFHAFVRRLDLRAPTIPVASNLTGTWMTEADATDPDYWVRHLRKRCDSPTDSRVDAADASVLLEVGPGRTLATLARQQVALARRLTSMPHPDEPVDDAAHALRAWTAVDRGGRSGLGAAACGRATPARGSSTYPFERDVTGSTTAGRASPGARSCAPKTCATGSPSHPETDAAVAQ